MRLTVREIAVFGMLGALMLASKALMDVLPNIHLIGTFIVAMTLVYRQKALYPIYVFVLLTGLFNGFATWWLPYLYIWTVLWGAAMLIPRGLKKRFAVPLCMVVSGLHGLLYGVLYAPAQALLFGLNFRGMCAWIVAGLPFDAIHGLSNFVCGALILPLAELMRRTERMTAR